LVRADPRRGLWTIAAKLRVNMAGDQSCIMANTTRATNVHTKGGSKQTQAAEGSKRQRRGAEGHSAKARGRDRPDAVGGRGHQGSNKAGSGQGGNKN
jgi:hypothetical protein